MHVNATLQFGTGLPFSDSSLWLYGMCASAAQLQRPCSRRTETAQLQDYLPAVCVCLKPAQPQDYKM